MATRRVATAGVAKVPKTRQQGVTTIVDVEVPLRTAPLSTISRIRDSICNYCPVRETVRGTIDRVRTYCDSKRTTVDEGNGTSTVCRPKQKGGESLARSHLKMICGSTDRPFPETVLCLPCAVLRLLFP